MYPSCFVCNVRVTCHNGHCHCALSSVVLLSSWCLPSVGGRKRAVRSCQDPRCDTLFQRPYVSTLIRSSYRSVSIRSSRTVRIVIPQYRRIVPKGAIATCALWEYNDTKARSGVVPELHKHVCKMGVGCKYAIRNFTLLYQIALGSWRSQHCIMKTASLLDNGRGCLLELPYEDYLYHPDVSMRRLVGF